MPLIWFLRNCSNALRMHTLFELMNKHRKVRQALSDRSKIMQFVLTYKHKHTEPQSKHANAYSRWY